MFVQEPMSIARTDFTGKSNNNAVRAIPPVRDLQRLRLTKSRKVSAKDYVQILANKVGELGYAFAGYALLLDALLSFVSPAHCGRIPYWPLLSPTLAQRGHFGRLLVPQKHQRSALWLAVKAFAQPGVHLARFLGPQEHRRSALSLSVKSAVRWIVL
jgi:hypothetical protein